MPAKKSKTDARKSEDDLGLSVGIKGLETGNERTPLSPKSSNVGKTRSERHVHKRKGVSIFDLGKGKAAERGGVCDGPEPPTRSHFKRSSITIPRSKLFNRGRESRDTSHPYYELDSDKMDVDELQVDDAAFHIGMEKTQQK